MLVNNTFCLRALGGIEAWALRAHWQSGPLAMGFL